MNNRMNIAFKTLSILNDAMNTEAARTDRAVFWSLMKLYLREVEVLRSLADERAK